ncbi:hypothetical protein AUEXF2481DRAFT_26776 [Aureobasidium subglaciale EXF-2481]|uniref:Uncharacterized protein n=1 Tax=Aureobasidium subglaciale (strain EXF-2481) TaxID=1043005 RepID=A0A074YW55_AURSE|nr:uncharacterized protein AUEXF2481DRAFT_26776 [Aureobasidium subglaciale EXF-2481]KEQ98397.1 hypothetical protein AUEXF2481DRAFT_26776 [Aureobasidium subglaciale EXF-2481]
MVHFHSYISVIGVMGEAAPNVPICHDLHRRRASYEQTAPGPRSLPSLPDLVSTCLVHCHTLRRRKRYISFLLDILLMSDPSNEVMEKDRKVVDEVSGPGAVANKVDDRRDAPAGQERKKGAASASNPASQHGGTSLVSEPKADTPAPSMTQKKLVKMQNKLLKPAHDDGEFEDIDLGDSEQEININEWERLRKIKLSSIRAFCELETPEYQKDI